MSTGSMTAATTIAPRVASGSCSKSPVRNSRVMTDSTATKRPETCDFAPAPPLTAVLERLPSTTMPDATPEPTLAAPRPSSSWLASTS